MVARRKILFIGDSVTAANRSWVFPSGLGYVKKIGDVINPQWEVVNKAKNGDRLIDLERRWNKDVLLSKAEVISVNIGINETWRRFDSNDPTSSQDFLDCYEEVILRTRKHLINSRILLCEPFLLVKNRNMKEWRADLDEKIEVVRFLAEKYSLRIIPFDQQLNGLLETVRPEILSKDGIHPLKFANEQMASIWLSQFCHLTQK